MKRLSKTRLVTILGSLTVICQAMGASGHLSKEQSQTILGLGAAIGIVSSYLTKGIE